MQTTESTRLWSAAARRRFHFFAEAFGLLHWENRRPGPNGHSQIGVKPPHSKGSRQVAVASMCILGAFAAAGCGERLPEVVPVYGTVTWQGKPLTDGTVMLHPKHATDGGQPRRPATGLLDEQGSYRVSTFRTDDGAMPGQYYVLVHSYLSRPSDAGDDDSMVPQYVWRIPERHGNPEQCGRVLEIPSGSPSIEYNIDLDE